jgi:hypothetical protein
MALLLPKMTKKEAEQELVLLVKNLDFLAEKTKLHPVILYVAGGMRHIFLSREDVVSRICELSGIIESSVDAVYSASEIEEAENRAKQIRQDLGLENA